MTPTGAVKFQNWLIRDKVVFPAKYDEDGNLVKEDVRSISTTTVNIKGSNTQSNL